MRLLDLFEASLPYTVSDIGRTGYRRIGLWFQPATGKIVDAHSKNHAEVVATEPARFGIPRQEMAAAKRHEDFELDWNEPVIKLANAHGWVRVMGEGQAKSFSLNLQSSNKREVLATARRFVPEFAPVVVFVDFDVQDYNNVWHVRLEGDDIDRYLKSGRLPRA